MKRSAFTLMELITAMLASTVLIVSLSATVMISTNLLEVPSNDKQGWQQREIADRLSNDLRYATSVSELDASSFQITRPDFGNGSQTVTYQSALDTLTRQVDSHPVVTLEAQSPSLQFTVDGYSAPTIADSLARYPRVRSWSTAATAVQQSSLSIFVPTACKVGDWVFLCVSGKTPTSLTLAPSGWQTLQAVSYSDLRLFVFYRRYDSSWTPATTISSSPNAAIAAVMFTIEHADPDAPIPWTSSRSGFAWSFLPSTHPVPLEAAGIADQQLNLQVFASERTAWSSGTLGMASFTDVASATAAASDFWVGNSVGVVIRSGASPTLTGGSRVMYSNSGGWLQVGATIEAAP